MADEQKQDVAQESSSALGEAIASSPEALAESQEAQGTETGTPQQPESQEQNVPFNEHPRFKELIEERNWYRQQLEQRLAQQPQPQPQFQQPAQDPYAGMTPEEERFWRASDQRAEKIAEQKVRQFSPIIDAGRMELAQMKVQQFRNAHPDIKPNSPEEMAIAEKISSGYLPEDAYRSVMWDSKVADTEKQANTQVKQKMEAKKQANVENRSISHSALPAAQQKLNLRQRIEQNWSKMERGEL